MSNTTVCANVMCANSGKMNNLVLETSSNSSSNTALLKLTNTYSTTAADASAAVLELNNNPSTLNADDGDDLGIIKFTGIDDAGNATTYASILAESSAVASTSEEGKLTFNLATTTSGASETVLTLQGGASAATSSVAVPGLLTQFKKTVTTGAFTLNRLNIGTTASGSIVTVPTTDDNSDIGLPVISSGLAGWHVTLVCAADNGAHTITLRQGGAADGSGTLAATPFFGVLMDDGANSLVGTTSAVVAASKFKKGDHIDLICDGTNYIIKVHAVTAAAVTAS